jgi:hypothetical protein
MALQSIVRIPASVVFAQFSSHFSPTYGRKKMDSRQVKEVLETLLICISIVAITVVLWTYHPTEAPRPPATCATDTSGTAPTMPALMMAKENK